MKRTINLFGSLLLIGVLLVNATVYFNVAQAGSEGDYHEPLWNVLINNDDLPLWLQIQNEPRTLYTEYQLSTLAGNLINTGVVAASNCPNGGLADDGKANDCGINSAAPAMYTWQNQFNAAIINASQQTSVPAVILKNIFAWESEFWPRTVFINTSEFGLGHMTSMGADSLLRWNYPFYDSFCNANLSSENCQKVYVEEPAYIQSMLRGLVLQQVNADCSACKYSLDLIRAEQSIPIFANTLIANAKLVKHYIQIYTGQEASKVSGYEDLWDFTLVSYNAGPGCFKDALLQTIYASKPINWKNISSNLEPACRGAIAYIKFIRQMGSYHPEDDPGLLATATATPITTSITSTPSASETTVSTATLSTEASPTSTVEAASPIPTDATSTAAANIPAPTNVTSTAIANTPAPTDATSTVATNTPEPTDVSPTPVTNTPAPTEAKPSPSATSVDPSVLEPLHVGNELVLKVDPQKRNSVLQTLQSLNITPAETANQAETPDTLIVQVDPAKLEASLSTLRNTQGVQFVEPNYLVKLSGTFNDVTQPNDPQYPGQTNLAAIQVPQTWGVLTNTQPVIVAVLDTGVDINHPDLTNSIWQNPTELAGAPGVDDDHNGYVDDLHGWNFVDGNNNVADDNGHGTHLAGIIGASANNGIGIAGIAPNARILPIKVLDKNGYGSYSNVADGIIYATKMGARVINLGFGGTGSSELMQNAIDYALVRNVLIVAAAGNSGDTTTYYPAGYSGVIAVSAVDGNDGLAGFSSTGNDINLTAPGVGILSTTPGGTYARMSGTSMAAANVSGVAALLAGQQKFADMNLLRSNLLSSARDLGPSGRDPQYGYGLVQAFSALNYSGPIIATFTPAPTPAVTPISTGVGKLNVPPVVSITAPTGSPTYVHGTTITFTGTATDFEDGNIGASIIWYSDLNGPIGKGPSVSTSILMAGTHTINAQVTDSGGLKTIASIMVTITDVSGPHKLLAGNTDECALCHRAHSAAGDTYLTTDPNPVLTSDAFCLTCHTNVSTHSNKNFPGAAEAPFEVRCIQCHDPHGTSNLFGIRTGILTSLSPNTASGPVNFTSLTGTNSYDDGVSTNRLCTTCHTSITNHPGGANHNGPNDYIGQSCVACHPHNADASATTLDGFMPVRTTNP